MYENLEVTVGFEPTYSGFARLPEFQVTARFALACSGFADRCLNYLATSPETAGRQTAALNHLPVYR